jgi:hypothetical protein
MLEEIDAGGDPSCDRRDKRNKNTGEKVAAGRDQRRRGESRVAATAFACLYTCCFTYVRLTGYVPPPIDWAPFLGRGGRQRTGSAGMQPM